MNRRGNLLHGAGYLIEGFRLLSHPRLRLFVVVPVLVNFVLFMVITSLLIQQFTALLNYLMEWLPGFLDFLAWVVGIILALMILLVYGYGFSMITNVIAAPFYGILAEKAEEIIIGRPLDGEPLLQMIPRTLLRELRKVWYFLWRSLIIFMLTFIPLIGAAIGVLWGAWSMAIQYGDYAADNHQTDFHRFRTLLSARLWSSLGFGGIVILGLMVPVLNILVMPAAVVGGTLFWVEELRGVKVSRRMPSGRE